MHFLKVWETRGFLFFFQFATSTLLFPYLSCSCILIKSFLFSFPPLAPNYPTRLHFAEASTAACLCYLSFLLTVKTPFFESVSLRICCFHHLKEAEMRDDVRCQPHLTPFELL